MFTVYVAFYLKFLNFLYKEVIRESATLIEVDNYLLVDIEYLI